MIGSLPSFTASSADLILIPSFFEKAIVASQLETLVLSTNIDVQLCGVGLVQAGIRSVYWLHQVKPRRVWLLGIAGTYLDRLSITQAYEFSHIGCYGIGVGSGLSYQSPTELGWQDSLDPGMGSYLKLGEGSVETHLLSVTAASADGAEAEQKLREHPQMKAEDMESYAVALACQAYGIPLRVIRGISNTAGDRDFSRWRAAEAMQAALEMTAELMRVP